MLKILKNQGKVHNKVFSEPFNDIINNDFERCIIFLKYSGKFTVKRLTIKIFYFESQNRHF